MTALCLLPPAPKLPLPSSSSSSSYLSTNAQSKPLPLSSSGSPPPPPPLKHTNFEALKNRLIRLTEKGNLQEAISTLDTMNHHHHLAPDLLTYSILLKSCIRSRQFELGKLVHAKLTRSPLKLDPIVLNTLISLYSKSGDWVTAAELFESMGEMRNLVSWSSMVSCYANHDMGLRAIAAFCNMLESGFYPNEYTFAAVIRACSNPENESFGRVIFGFVIRSGYLYSDVCVGCALIDMFVKCGGDSDSALKVFARMPERNVVTWTLMITRLAQTGHPGDAIDLYFDMESSGSVADRFTLSAVISACAELGFLSLGRQLHSRAIRTGIALDVCVGCSLVDMYVKCVVDGSVKEAREVFDHMTDHNVMSWSAMITGYVQSGRHDKEAIELFHKMTGSPVHPNHFTFSSVLKACGNLSDLHMGAQVYAYAVKMGLGSVNCVGNSIISMHARAGRMEDARKAFDVLFEKNLVSSNVVADGYAKNLNYNFNQMADTEDGSNAFTFASLLSGAASIGSISKGEQIHARLLKAGFSSNICISNALVSMYSRCGNIEAASVVFGQMGPRNLISWTSIISGFSKHGFAMRALELFHKMMEAGIKPNEVTYIAVLSACSHAGLISEGWKHFNSMQKEHKIFPRMEHYACMVDLLGRLGLLSEAFDFINSLPIKADALVWRTLLGACRVHGNSQLGEHAAKMVLEQDPHDPAAYILLSNICASVDRWDDVVSIRKSMKEKKLVKEAGCSWIEIESQVHKFFVGDTLHPRATQIYEELDQLVVTIKKLGYVPDTNLVLHDMEEEQKEQYLLQHSEKIAVVFGLISTFKPKPIRVFKNLRVCGDCHTAIKYISLATGREIVIRDSNRFHHVKDGACSCNDYW